MLKKENKIFKNLYNDHGWEIDNAIKLFNIDEIPTLMDENDVIFVY